MPAHYAGKQWPANDKQQSPNTRKHAPEVSGDNQKRNERPYNLVNHANIFHTNLLKILIIKKHPGFQNTDLPLVDLPLFGEREINASEYWTDIGVSL